MRWNMKYDSRGSPDMAVIRRPRSDRKLMPGPKFSNDLKILRKFRVRFVVSSVVMQA